MLYINLVSDPQPASGKIHGSYLCQLCPQKFSRRSTLLMHYTVYHKVHNVTRSECCNENLPARRKRKNFAHVSSKRNNDNVRITRHSTNSSHTGDLYFLNK